MTVKNGKIVEATDRELWEYWMRSGMSDIMSYTLYKHMCLKLGTTLIEEATA